MKRARRLSTSRQRIQRGPWVASRIGWKLRQNKDMNCLRWVRRGRTLHSLSSRSNPDMSEVCPIERCLQLFSGRGTTLSREPSVQLSSMLHRARVSAPPPPTDVVRRLVRTELALSCFSVAHYTAKQHWWRSNAGDVNASALPGAPQAKWHRRCLTTTNLLASST